MARDIVMGHIAFYWTESIGIPKLFYAARWLDYAIPCQPFATLLILKIIIVAAAIGVVFYFLAHHGL
jgi:hypothetical protein